MNASPPALLRGLLERSLSSEVRDGIVGDLDEVYLARRSLNGAMRAHLWYAGQVLAISSRFTVERVRDALSTGPLSIGLDLKLGFRMLIKYPMLTVVGGIARRSRSGLRWEPAAHRSCASFSGEPPSSFLRG